MDRTMRKPNRADLKVAGLDKVWSSVKAATGTAQRGPKLVTVTDKPVAAMPDDSDCCHRFVVDLATGEVRGSVYVHAGESALMNRGQDAAVESVPEGAAVVTFTWNDYYRTSCMEVQVAPGTLRHEPELVAANG